MIPLLGASFRLSLWSKKMYRGKSLTLSAFIFCSFFLLSCLKKKPDNNNPASEAIFEWIDKSSINFSRTLDKTTGNFQFQLKGDYSCRVEYWSTDPNVTPNMTSPLAKECPDGLLAITLKFENLDPKVVYKFTIYVWEKGKTIADAKSIIFNETATIAAVDTTKIILLQHNTPTKSTELYNFQIGRTVSTAELTKTYANQNTSNDSNCSDVDPRSEFPFAKTNSQDDDTSNPLDGLSNAVSDGYGVGRALEHPYYKDRLYQVYDGSVDPGLTWVWKFRWNGNANSISSWPPSFWSIRSLSIKLNDRLFPQAKADLAATVNPLEISQTNPEFVFQYEPAEAGFIHLHFKSKDDPNRALYCVFQAGSSTYKIPDSDWQSLPTGQYDVMAIYEAFQIRFKEKSNFPPWVFVMQDWVYTSIDKRG
jgi:hypothetical protein